MEDLSGRHGPFYLGNTYAATGTQVHELRDSAIHPGLGPYWPSHGLGHDWDDALVHHDQKLSVIAIRATMVTCAVCTGLTFLAILAVILFMR